jgi:hypothetical protein
MRFGYELSIGCRSSFYRRRFNYCHGRFLSCRFYYCRFNHRSSSGTAKFTLFDALVDYDCEVAARSVDNRRQALCRRLDEEEKLREQLFLTWHVGKLGDLLNGDNFAVNDTKLEGKRCIVLDPGG